MSQSRCPAVEGQELVVPLALIMPGKSGTAERVFGGAHADLITIVNTWRARHGHLAEHAQAEGTLVISHDPQRPGGVMTVEHIQLGVVHLPIIPCIQLVDLAGETRRCSPVRLQSTRGSLPPPLFQNRACQFPGTRLLSDMPLVMGTRAGL
jgi:hypothetical protein